MTTPDWRTWDALCACGHAACRHDHSPAQPGPALNLAGPCHWCRCAAFTRPTPSTEEKTR